MQYWYAYIYDKHETEQGEAQDILALLETPPQNILEVACGSGRIAIPLARAGHNVTGFDIDEYALARIPQKADGLNNFKYFAANALEDVWPVDFDVVVISGNLLVNIITKGDYTAAQEMLIKKAAESAKPGGYLYLDFTCIVNWQDVKTSEERVIFEGTDDAGTYGRFIYVGGKYNHEARMDISQRRYEIKPKNSDAFEIITESVKHFPALQQVKCWLEKYGWEIKWHSPIIDKTFHAKIWAKRV